MLKRNFHLRVAGPTILVSALLFVLCSTAIVYLGRQQTLTAEAFGEDVGSREVANNLEIALRDLDAALHAGQRQQIAVLQDHVAELLVDAERLADKAEEARLVGMLKDSYQRYLKEVQTALPGHPQAGLGILEKELLPTCRQLRVFNT